MSKKMSATAPKISVVKLGTKLDSIKNGDNKIIVYPKAFSEDAIEKIIELLTRGKKNKVMDTIEENFYNVTERRFSHLKPNEERKGSIACLFLRDGENQNVSFLKGDLAIFGINTGVIDFPKYTVKLYEENYLPYIYQTIKRRKKFRSRVKQISKEFYNDDIAWVELQKIFNMTMVGKGCYGNVYSSSLKSYKFAVKLSEISDKLCYNKNYSCWHEIYFLKELFRKLNCPNLPKLINMFSHKTCELNIKDNIIKTPCVISITELASSTLEKYGRKKHTISEWNSAIFQIFSALHTIQTNGQILHYDIKKENILIYNVIPGGFWKYKIMGKTYLVPNHGHLFVLADFGLARPMSPYFPLYKSDDIHSFRLGSRYAYISDGKFIPLNISASESKKISWVLDSGEVIHTTGVEFKMDRKTKHINKVDGKIPDVLNEYKITSKKFFNNPLILPPFEFYNDVQDIIRMFLGGKRTTQKGNHRKCQMPKIIQNKLCTYLGPSENIKEGKFTLNPSHVLAGYFINSYFSPVEDGAHNAGAHNASIEEYEL